MAKSEGVCYTEAIPKQTNLSEMVTMNQRPGREYLLICRQKSWGEIDQEEPEQRLAVPLTNED